MLQILKLLLPALIPSWRFFDTIAPSPRIEFTLLRTAQDIAVSWQEFQPRPPKLPIRGMLRRIFWNPSWNESLYLVSCAELLITTPTDHSTWEIVKRIGADLQRNCIAASSPYFQFRLAFLSRDGAQIQRQILFTSPIYRYSGSTDS